MVDRIDALTPSMKVLSIFGTRPEAIKMAPVIKTMVEHPDGLASRICVTAQHREMLDQVLDLFDIHPDFDLDVMRPGQSPMQVAVAVMKDLEPIIVEEQPDWVLVQGDTTTVMAASLTAFYCKVKVAHLEAGLRTFSRDHPFPEEINRRLAGVVADLHFAPTLRARQNLLLEGAPDERILVAGNTVIDALQLVAEVPYDPSVGPLADVRWDRRIILATSHRRENFGKPLENICRALLAVAEQHTDDVDIVFSVHPNPDVRHAVNELLGHQPNIKLLPPLDYLPFVYLLRRSTLVLTDSGGIQEEAPAFGKPVLVLREVTERPEAAAAGTVQIVGTSRRRIREATERLLQDPAEYRRMARTANPYGDGLASWRVTEALLEARDRVPAVSHPTRLDPSSKRLQLPRLTVPAFRPTTAIPGPAGDTAAAV